MLAASPPGADGESQTPTVVSLCGVTVKTQMTTYSMIICIYVLNSALVCLCLRLTGLEASDPTASGSLGSL